MTDGLATRGSLTTNCRRLPRTYPRATTREKTYPLRWYHLLIALAMYTGASAGGCSEWMPEETAASRRTAAGMRRDPSMLMCLMRAERSSAAEKGCTPSRRRATTPRSRRLAIFWSFVKRKWILRFVNQNVSLAAVRPVPIPISVSRLDRHILKV